MKFIIGLGNPGKDYERTRHNLGFRAVDALARAHRITWAHKAKFKADIGELTLDGSDAILVKPHTFMNLSGESVAGLLHWHKASVLDMLVVHDDLDVPFGTLRFREKGSSGGHNGIESIIQHCSADIFARLKLGIGRPPVGLDPAKYVLMPFSAEEEQQLPPVIAQAVQRIEQFIRKR